MLVELQGLGRREAVEFYGRAVAQGDREVLRWLCRNDRYFLLTAVLGMDYLNNEWGYARCREVEAEPDGCLDLWSRGHFKSTIITLGGTVQEILRDAEQTFCVLSYNGSTARKFVGQIMAALESEALVRLFPEILWQKAPKTNWSTQNGLWVKRKSLAKEPTVMGSGLVDGMPTGMHFNYLIYDDIVTPQSVSSPEQIAKTNEAVEISAALGILGETRVRMIGTRYHPLDTYHEIAKKGVVKVRRRLCVDEEGNPTLLSREALEMILREMGARTYAAQMLQNPVGAGVRVFSDEWLCFYDRQPEPRKLNIYIIIDSANAKRKGNDYTIMWVIGLAADQNYYVLDIVRDKMNLVERTKALQALHRKWQPLCCYWEQVGAMSDTQHVRDVQEREGYRFRIVDLKQALPKRDRIEWLVPLFEGGRIWLPRRLLYATVQGDTRDLVADFMTDEYSVYPVVSHDDMLDALANVSHPGCSGMRFPLAQAGTQGQEKSNGSWDPYA